MNYVFDHIQEQNGYFDVLNSDENPDCLNIEDAFVNPIGKSFVKFEDIKLPSNDILNYEAENHDYYKSFDYENTSEDALSSEVDIKPLSLFAEEKSDVYQTLDLNHGNSKDAHYFLWKNPTTKETSNDYGELIHSTIMLNVKANEIRSDPLTNEITSQSKKVDKLLEKTKKIQSGKKKLSKKCKRFRKFGYTRWGRKEDSKMFSVLRQLCKQENVDIDEFWTDHSKISTKHNCLLINLVSQMNWRSDTQSLLKRIQTLARDQTLSIRQMHTLKRFRRKAERENRDFELEDVVDSFPGKSIATLQSALEKIQADFKN